MSRILGKYPYKALYFYVGQIRHSHYNSIKHTLKYDVDLDEKQQYI
jgi:hypothetical protein